MSQLVYIVSSLARGGERRDSVAAALSSSDEDEGPPLQRRRLHEVIHENRIQCIDDATAAKDIERIPGMVCWKTF